MYFQILKNLSNHQTNSKYFVTQLQIVKHILRFSRCWRMQKHDNKNKGSCECPKATLVSKITPVNIINFINHYWAVEDKMSFTSVMLLPYCRPLIFEGVITYLTFANLDVIVQTPEDLQSLEVPYKAEDVDRSFVSQYRPHQDPNKAN